MLQAEADRATTLLAPHTHTALLTAAEQALIEPAVQPALSDGFAELVSQRKVPQLNCMFKLFHRLGPDAVKGLCGTFASYVKGAATAIVQNKEADKVCVAVLACASVCHGTPCILALDSCAAAHLPRL